MGRPLFATFGDSKSFEFHYLLITLTMEAARTTETTVNFYRLHGATTQKTAIFVLAAVIT
jgi:hypothetical protein